MNKEEFINELKKIGLNITKEQLNKLNLFYNILIEWNNKINLTRIVEENDVYLKHFYDSLTLIKVVNFNEPKTLCDVGSGAGFPGIVLKIIFPELEITLIDSLQKRVNYLNNIIVKLDLKKIKAVHTRSEDYHEKFDIVTARAVASIDKLIPWCIHLMNTKGKFIAMKAKIENEINVDEKILKKYKCKISQVETFYLPIENSIRNLIVIEKKS